MFHLNFRNKLLYSYTINDTTNIFCLFQDSNSNYVGMFQEGLCFQSIEDVEKLITHLTQNFYYFLKNNYDFDSLKKDSMNFYEENEVIGKDYFYFFSKTKNYFLLEFPNDICSDNPYDFYEFFLEFSEKIKNDIKNYKEKHRKIIINLIGASGSGKTTIGNYLKTKGIPELISHTTREKRDGETEGETYYYITPKEFEELEKVQKSYYSNNSYCLSKKEIDNKLTGNKYSFVITAIDGANQIKENCKETNIEVIKVFVKTDLETMKQRMLARGDKEEKVEERLAYAITKKEFENEKYVDFVVDNTKDFENTKKQIDKILNNIK